MATETNFITVPRKLFSQDAFAFEPYTRREALLDLIQMATHEQRNIMIAGGERILSRGQIAISIRTLSSRWGWGRDKVQRVLNEFERAGFIGHESDTVITTISINNYDLYQKPSDTNRTRIGQESDKIKEDNSLSSTNVESKDIIKNNNISPSGEDNKLSPPSTPKGMALAVDRIYKLYPSKCPVKGRPTGKSSSDKKRVERLLKIIPEEKLAATIARYVKECISSGTPIKNFSTFLNNLPDYDETGDTDIFDPPSAQQRPSKTPEEIAEYYYTWGYRDIDGARMSIRESYGHMTDEEINEALRKGGFEI